MRSTNSSQKSVTMADRNDDTVRRPRQAIIIRIRVLIWLLVLSLWGIMVYQFLGQEDAQYRMSYIANPLIALHPPAVPGTGWTTPSDKQIAQFFALASESPRRRIFVHCWFGGDRVGMFMAAYRITFDGWTADEAIHEMRAYRYNVLIHPNMKWYIRKFPKRLAKSPALAAYRQPPKREEPMPVSPSK